MTIDLEQITFGPMEESLKQEIKADISNFKLNLFKEEIRVKRVHLDLINEEYIIIDCGIIKEFEYPIKSREQRIENECVSINDGCKAINIYFLYNNKNYSIYSYI
jgi:hypothetical protein